MLIKILRATITFSRVHRCWEERLTGGVKKVDMVEWLKPDRIEKKLAILKQNQYHECEDFSLYASHLLILFYEGAPGIITKK